MDDDHNVSPLCSIPTPPSSASSRRAVIDIGTNSVKLLVAEVSGRTVRPLLECNEQTRLGGGFYETRRLQPEAIERSAKAVARFAGLAAQFQSRSTRVIATSAAREAKNQRDLVEAVRQAAGMQVEVITGEQEAEWVFQGVTTDETLASQPLFILDVGGGSTELILGEGLTQHFSRSFAVGTVRLLEKLPLSDPPTSMELSKCLGWLSEFLVEEVVPPPEVSLSTRSSGSRRLVGTGGTATIMARIESGLVAFDRERIEATRLGRHQVDAQLRRLWSLPLAKREEIIGLPPSRADIILMGVAIYFSVMEHFNFAELIVSTRSLRYAAVMADAFCKSLAPP